MINRFNNWYDQLAEGRRFGLFMLMATCSVFLLNLGVTIGNGSLMTIGLCNTTIMVFIAASRAFGHGGAHAKVGAVMVGLMIFVVIAALGLMIL